MKRQLKIVFRADASLQIGIGHLMRCLTLADALKAQGAVCQFICREHPGNLIKFIRSKGYTTHALPQREPAGANSFAEGLTVSVPDPAHAHWLGATHQQDAVECESILATLQPDWLIVDHYALDSRWERALKAHYQKLMVIDDLADRRHDCDLLLDQNLGRQPSDYAQLVPGQCTVLAGPQYALLRPEFAALRKYSLERREKSRFQNLLITMGGVDQPNATGRVLETLKQCLLPDDCRISVVMGASAPWLEQVRVCAAGMPRPTEVLVNVSDMAQRMADCDLAIGAAGSTSWERCCLGVPALMVILADNQTAIGKALHCSEAAILVCSITDEQFKANCLAAFSKLMGADSRLEKMSQAAANITNGLGCDEVVRWLLEK